MSRAQSTDSVVSSRNTETSMRGVSDSLPHVIELGLQFLGGELVFNATSFALWGNDLYKGFGQPGFGAGLGILASMITVPLAVHFTSALLGLKSGSWPWASVASFAGFFLVNLSLPPAIRNHSYFSRYLFTSMPIITIAQLVYDLTM